MTDLAVEVRGLRRVYQARRGAPEARTALDGIDLDVVPGQIHGLLGPNGAGKTTLVKILSTVLLPTEGTARVLGYDVVEHRQDVRTRIGTVFGSERGLYARVSVRRNLLFWASLYGLSGRVGRHRTEQLIERVGLAERADDRVEELSKGMVQRVHLARGLIGDPRMVFLDEPTTGLDPVAALDFRALLGELLAEGRTFLLTTHDLDEAAALCAEVTVIDRGTLLMTSNVRDVGRRLAAPDRVDFDAEDNMVLEKLRGSGLVNGVSELDKPGRYRAEATSKESLTSVIRLLADEGITSLSTSPPTLEEVYLQLVGDRGMAV
ncbi:ABC transporter ATP-binding protein [Streptantibioticus ferralitis]|uniref:ABC transporter ATP-binding protein n=1 Tax=Streptantibioticus ferralitis TaxID=236510 RepID=A0ABT5Z1L4_9ACTN|nr:ABC transporter ATP-binding protein [Streptantibioticus ferralitis]MDF2257734.1 ABC transporter ATP-binding protein [Streptantibioticus ferralitis]